NLCQNCQSLCSNRPNITLPKSSFMQAISHKIRKMLMNSLLTFCGHLIASHRSKTRNWRCISVGSFRIMTRAELRTRRRLPPEDLQLFDQFKQYLTRLNGTDVGVYEYSKGEDHERCKALLRKAAR